MLVELEVVGRAGQGRARIVFRRGLMWAMKNSLRVSVCCFLAGSPMDCWNLAG